MRKFFTLGQIIILVFGIVAISWAVGSEVEFVKGVRYTKEDGIYGLPGDNTYNYKKEGGDWYTKNKNSNTWTKIESSALTQNKKDLATSRLEDYAIAVNPGQKNAKTVAPNPSAKTTNAQRAEIESDLDYFLAEREAEAQRATKSDKWYSKENLFGTTQKGIGWKDATETLLWGAAKAEAAKSLTVAIGKAAKLKDEQAEALGEGIRLGIYSATITDALTKLFGRSGGSAGTYVGIAVAAWYILNNYKDLDERNVVFECSVWEAPRGGENCNKCNNNIFGCSEYQCESLGKDCQLLNPGTDEELCSWVNRNDAEAPEIRPYKDALSEEFEYVSDTSISPPDRGVKIQQIGEGCIPAYEPLSFGVSLNEPATCKIDVERKDNYEDMSYYVGSSSTAKYNHTHVMTLPSTEAIGTIIQEGTNMSLFVRCEDANGNSNEAEYIFNFCVEKGEDFTPPLVVETSIPDNSYVAYNIGSTSLTAYVNEPATCKWDFTDKRYDLMNTTFSCSNNFEIKNVQTVYPCATTITGIKDRTKNNYYIRCNDTSGNENKESYKLALIGTQPLYIDFAKPNGTTIKEAKSPIPVTLEVKTSSGADDGKAFCYYKPLDSLTGYVQFLYNPVERTYQHTQELSLGEGIYDYSIKCIDDGGNEVYRNISFDVAIDTSSPVVIRAYREEGYLKLITDESGECVYNNDEDIGCKYEFDDGISMQTVDKDEQFVEWDSQKTYYIKCKDEFDNPPAFNACSIIARPSSGQTL